jgi:thiamine kinase-like enzyme
LVKDYKDTYNRVRNGEEITTLIHWDLSNSNILFRGDDFKVIDWQWASIGNPIVDILRFLV